MMNIFPVIYDNACYGPRKTCFTFIIHVQMCLRYCSIYVSFLLSFTQKSMFHFNQPIHRRIIDLDLYNLTIRGDHCRPLTALRLMQIDDVGSQSKRLHTNHVNIIRRFIIVFWTSVDVRYCPNSVAQFNWREPSYNFNSEGEQTVVLNLFHFKVLPFVIYILAENLRFTIRL